MRRRALRLAAAGFLFVVERRFLDWGVDEKQEIANGEDGHDADWYLFPLPTEDWDGRKPHDLPRLCIDLTEPDLVAPRRFLVRADVRKRIGRRNPSAPLVAQRGFKKKPGLDTPARDDVLSSSVEKDG